MKRDPFFVGWSNEIARVDRRFVLGAGAAIIAAGAGLGTVLGGLQNAPGNGAWDQSDVRTWTGLVLAQPYPMLRTLDLDGRPRTAFLATSGKTAVQLAPEFIGQSVAITASLIRRGNHAMLAVVDAPNWINLVAQSPAMALGFEPERDIGPVALVGEILDAKCWFGAMRPGYGKSHKACATLCARGGLPLAFCIDTCGASDAPILLDEHGLAHSRAILPYIADPVFIVGRRIEVGDMTQIRVALPSIRRI